MRNNGGRRPNNAARVEALHSADRARELAAHAVSPLVAELFEIHARMCEQNAEMRRSRRKGKAPTLVN